MTALFRPVSEEFDGRVCLPSFGLRHGLLSTLQSLCQIPLSQSGFFARETQEVSGRLNLPGRQPAPTSECFPFHKPSWLGSANP